MATNLDDDERAALAERAWELRASGASFRAIGAELSVSVSTVHGMIGQQAQVRGSLELGRHAEVRRDLTTIDQWLSNLDRAAKRARPGEVAMLARAAEGLLSRRARLLGTNSATRLRINGDLLGRNSGGAPLDLDAEV